MTAAILMAPGFHHREYSRPVVEAEMRHTQIFVHAEVRKPLLSPENATRFMRAAVAAAGMNIIGGPWSIYGIIPGNEGVSSTVLLDFSSANLHEWPDALPFPRIEFDLYTCGVAPDPEKFRDLFVSIVDPVVFASTVVDRDRLPEMVDQAWRYRELCR